MKHLSEPIVQSSFSAVLTYILCVLLFAAPLYRGLFFEQHLLPFVIFVPLLFIFYLYDQYRNDELELFKSPLDWAILALLAASVISLINAVDIRSAVINVMRLCSYVMVFWMCFRSARKEEGYSTITMTFYLGGICLTVLGLLIFSGIIHYPYGQVEGRITSTLEYPNTFGIYAAVIFTLGWGITLSKTDLLQRALFSGGNAILLMGMLGSLSRGVWVLLPFTILAYLLLIGRRNIPTALFAGLAAFLPAVIMTQLLLAHALSSIIMLYVVLGFVLAVGLQYGFDFISQRLQLCNKITIHFNKYIIAGVVLLFLAIFILYVQNPGSVFSKGSLARLTEISLQDRNVQARLNFYGTAIEIVKDYPVIGSGGGGWGALYHQYSNSLYWTDKNHNYFLQVWLENGTLGFLALISIWVTFVIMLWRFKIKEEVNDDTFPLFWGGAIACFFLGAHSILDFDMSYSSIAFLLFGLMGTLQGKAAQPATILDAPVKETRKQMRRQKEVSIQNKQIFLIASGCGVLVSLALIINSACLMAARSNFISAQSIMNQNAATGQLFLEKALDLDPLNASYWDQSAFYWAAVANTNQNLTAYNRSLQDAKKALELVPYNIPIVNDVNQLYIQLGKYDEAVSVANKLVKINPWDPASYENLANCDVLAGVYYVEQGQPNKAHQFWSDALNVPNMLPSSITPPIGLKYTSGQALLLLGNKEQGEQALREMLAASSSSTDSKYLSQVESMRIYSRIYLVASLEMSGNTIEAQKLIDQIPSIQQKEARELIEKFKTWVTKANVNKGPS